MKIGRHGTTYTRKLSTKPCDTSGALEAMTDVDGTPTGAQYPPPWTVVDRLNARWCHGNEGYYWIMGVQLVRRQSGMALELFDQGSALDSQDPGSFILYPVGFLKCPGNQLALKLPDSNRPYQDLACIIPHDQLPRGGGVYAQLRGSHPAGWELTGADGVHCASMHSAAAPLRGRLGRLSEGPHH